MATEAEINLDTIPMEELRQLALAEEAKTADVAAAPATQAEPAPQRDAQGRFRSSADVLDNSAEATEDEAVVEEEPDEFVYRKEIDLGDGSGVQVFSGKGSTAVAALEELTEKLADAQKNATRKIHDLGKQIKAQPKEREFTADEEYVFSQEMMTKPTAAFKKLFEETVGCPITEFKTQVEAVKTYNAMQRSNACQASFLTSHPDYETTPANGKLMAKWVETHGYTEFTEENLEKAYQDLSQSGLLKIKSEGADADTAQTTETKERIVPPQQDATQQRSQRRASTVSTKSRTAAPPVKTEPSEDELYAMDMGKLRNLSNAQLAERE